MQLTVRTDEKCCVSSVQVLRLLSVSEGKLQHPMQRFENVLQRFENILECAETLNILLCFNLHVF